jgi:predicted ATPase/class 3 adenylate cyclase
MPIFLFTDIEGSTRLWQQHRPVMLDMLRQHDAIVQTQLARFNGRLLKHTGDGIFALFADGAPALECALAIQQQIGQADWGDLGQLRIRMGLDGRAADRENLDYFRDGDDYFGPLINTAARIMDAAWGGQILFSPAVLELTTLPQGTSVQEFGTHQLKDVATPQIIMGLRHPGLPDDFPPLRTHSAQPNNLPVQPTPFIGRAAEIVALAEILADPGTRLITIVGSGGMGKTRLAVAVAEQQLVATRASDNGIAPRFPQGVYFVSLGSLQTADHILPALAEALQFPLQAGEQATRSPRQQLLDYVRHKRLLLIMDNFEHLLAGAALVADILQTATEVQILATSRERLNLREEQVYPIQGLDFPAQASEEEMAVYTAVQLFLQSARRERPHFDLSLDDLPHLAHICRLVEGVPLALELAASWVDLLTLADIAHEVQQGLDFLETELRNIAPRHRSMRAVFDYSWQLLNEVEKVVFPQLSVFRGGFSRQAATQVTGASLRVLAALVNKSLLQFDKTADRYQIHELLRQYGADRLAETWQIAERVRTHHSLQYMTLLQQQEESLKGAGQQKALATIEAERDNIRAAWEWSVAQGHWVQLGWVVFSWGLFLERNGRYDEGARLFQQTTSAMMTVADQPLLQARFLYWQARFSPTLERILLLQASLNLLADLPETQALLDKAAVTLALGMAQSLLGEHEMGQQHLRQSVALYQQVGDRWGEATALAEQGWWQRNTGQFAAAIENFETSLTIRRLIGDRRGIADSLGRLGNTAVYRGDFDKAIQLSQESKTICLELGDRPSIASTSSNLGSALLLSGAGEASIKLIEEALAIFTELGDRESTAYATIVLGMGRTYLGEYEAGELLSQQGLALARAISFQRGIGLALYTLSMAMLLQEKLAQAQTYGQEAIATFRELGLTLELTLAMTILAWIYLAQLQYETAEKWAYQALNMKNQGAFRAFLLIAYLLVHRGVAAAQTAPLIELYEQYNHMKHYPLFETLARRWQPSALAAETYETQKEEVDVRVVMAGLLQQLQALGWHEAEEM